MATRPDHINVSDPHRLAMLAKLPPRQELVVGMALNGRSKNQGPIVIDASAP
jgi:hypothetical protein